MRKTESEGHMEYTEHSENMENTENTENTVRIYTACTDILKNPLLYQQVLNLLPPGRRAAADRMKIDSGKRLSAGAGMLLMAALSDYIRGDMGSFASFQRISFETGEEGKPFLVEYPDVYFNLSHSGNRVMCAVSPVEVGCDVEIINPSHVKSVIRCFSKTEQILAAQSDENFFRLWTLKESIIKLSGKGMVIPLSSFEVTLAPLSVRQDFLPEPVILREYEVPQEEVKEEFGERPEEEAREEFGERPKEKAREEFGERPKEKAREEFGERPKEKAREEFEERPEEKDKELSKAGDRYCASCAVIGARLPLQMIQVDLEKVVAG